MAPRILMFFSIAMGVDYSVELMYFYYPLSAQFIGYNKIFQGSVCPGRSGAEIKQTVRVALPINEF